LHFYRRHLGHIPKDDFLDKALAFQTFLGQQASTPSAFLPPGAGDGVAPTVFLPEINPKTGHMECGICSEAMGGAAERSMAAASCGHAYCYDCLVQCDKCPMCRQSYSQNQLIFIYSS